MKTDSIFTREGFRRTQVKNRALSYAALVVHGKLLCFNAQRLRENKPTNESARTGFRREKMLADIGGEKTLPDDAPRLCKTCPTIEAEHFSDRN